jgi:hypothetical protein
MCEYTISLIRGYISTFINGYVDGVDVAIGQGILFL